MTKENIIKSDTNYKPISDFQYTNDLVDQLVKLKGELIDTKKSEDVNLYAVHYLIGWLSQSDKSITPEYIKKTLITQLPQLKLK